MVKLKKDKKKNDGWHRKLKIEQFEPHYQKEVKYIYAQSGCSYKKVHVSHWNISRTSF
jgi:hypothetical protein